MTTRRLLATWIVFFAAATLLNLIRAEHIAYSDLEQWNYGFPWGWLIHEVASIAGPKDLWTIELPNLVINSIVWAVIALALAYLLARLRPSSK